MKKLLMGLVVVVIIIVVVGGITINYLKPNTIELSELDESLLQGKDLGNPEDLKSIIEEVESKKTFPANPRIKVFYQGYFIKGLKLHILTMMEIFMVLLDGLQPLMLQLLIHLFFIKLGKD